MKQYKNASLIVCGAMCAILMVNNLVGKMSNWNEPSVIPGFWAMAGLCYPLLYCWLGVLLRAWKPEPKWWIQLLVAGMSMFCICRYLCPDEGWRIPPGTKAGFHSSWLHFRPSVIRHSLSQCSVYKMDC